MPILVRRVMLISVATLTGLSAGAAFPARSSAPAEAGLVPVQEPGPYRFREVPEGWDFYFTRAVYTGQPRGFYGTPNSWAIDFPKADRQFIIGIKRLTRIEAYDRENPVHLDDPRLRRYPLLYALEVGHMSLSEAEVSGLREYLLAGGFLIIDDFWGTREWENFAAQMRRVLPGYPIVDLPDDHPLLSVFYEVGALVQVPNVQQGIDGGRTWEQDGYIPSLRGIFDERGRLMVVINWNTDLGDAWEWADHPYYPLKFSNFAYQMGVNMVVYGLSH